MSKKGIKSLVVSLLFFIAFVTAITVSGREKAYAEQLGVMIEYVESSSSSVTINIVNYLGDTNDYTIYMCDANNPDNVWIHTYGYVTNNGYRLYSLNPSSSYIVQVCSATGNWSNPMEVSTSPEGQVEITKSFSKGTNEITVQWTPAADANYYVIEYYDSSLGASDARYTYTDACEIKIGDLNKNASYTVRVYPSHVGPNGSLAVSSLYKYVYGVAVLPTKPEKPVISNRYSKNDDSIQLETSRIANAEGYQYEVYDCVAKKTVKKFTGGRSDYSYFKCKNGAFKTLKIFKVRARAYTLNSDGEKQYGAWSGWSYCHKGLTYKYKKTAGKITLDWDKVGGAGRYTIYISTKKDSGYKKAGTSTTNKFTVKKCGSSTISKSKTYYIKIVPEIKVDGKFVQCADIWYSPVY